MNARARTSRGIGSHGDARGGSSPRLSAQETAVLLGYVSGLKLITAARHAGVRPGTAKQYLDRVRRKYQEVGRPARTKLELALRAREDGLLV